MVGAVEGTGEGGIVPEGAMVVVGAVEGAAEGALDGTIVGATDEV